MNSPSTTNSRTVRGFTLVELLVSMTLLLILMLASMNVLNAVATIDTRARARVDAFREARAGFEVMTRRISQAMLNTYWDYFDANNKSRNPTDKTFVAKTYGRQSELHFVCGPSKLGSTPLLPDASTSNLKSVTHGIFFQSPKGIVSSSTAANVNPPNLPNLLNVSGYFVEYTTDLKDRPKFLRDGPPPARWRFRLTEFNQGSEYLQVYRTTANSGASYGWFQNPLSSDPDSSPDIRSTRLLAENVVALIILPHRSPNDTVPTDAPQLAPYYFYDSRDYVSKPTDKLALLTQNQLPPMVQVTMVVIDERSAQRLQDLLGGTPEDVKKATDLIYLTSAPSGDLFKKLSTSGTETKEQYLADLKTLTNQLSQLKLTYRVFSTDVSILQAKWSES